MNGWFHDLEWKFWSVVLFVALFKVATAKRLSVWGGLISVVTAFFAAAVGAAPAAAWLGISPASVYYLLVTAAVTLLGEHIMRFLLDVFSTPERLIDLWKYYRNGGRK